MKGLKDFRRSLNKDRNSGGVGRPNNAAPALFMGVKNAVSIQPPKKVIRATRDYKSRAPQELSFSKGDFFHVLNDEISNPDWLEATNPLTNARGLVPASYFDILSKSGRPGQANGGLPGTNAPLGGPSSPPAGTAAGSSVVAKHGGGFYAIVKFDFVAERADELEASAGEPIIVIAQSNFEWFVAKPIGRLGGPGLIPVTFVELKDVTNGQKVENVDELISRGIIPKVEEWKKMTADYKKNTIPLGRFDFANQGTAPPLPQSQGQQQYYHPGTASSSSVNLPQVPNKEIYSSSSGLDPMSSSMGPPLELPAGMPPGEPLPTGLVTSAQVDSFHFEQGDYWFRIQASHVSKQVLNAPSHAPTAPTGEERDLILYRLYEDFYEFQIALLDHFPSEAGRETMSNGRPSERILPLMPGPLDQVDDLITSQRRSDLDTYINELCALPEYIMSSELVRLFFEPRPGDHCTIQPVEGRANAANPVVAAAPAIPSAPLPGAGSNGHNNGTNKYSENAVVGSLGNQNRSVDELGTRIGGLGMNEPSNGNRNSATEGPLLRSQPSMSKTPNTSGSRDSRGSMTAPQSSRVSGPGPSSGGMSSATNLAFIKIKIFNRATDDLVAIRVPPSVTYASLMEKVKERLGPEITILRYREPEAGGNVMMRLSDDDDLREFLSTADKFQLFADTR
jgi:bud emergence protein 1